MRIAILCILLCSILSCAEKTEGKIPVFVQQQEISITPPRVSATSTIIDSTVIITAQLGLENIAIYYTDDGTKPTQQSSRYKDSITVQKEGTYSFKAFHADWKPSTTASLKLYKKGITPHKIDWETKAHHTYPGVGPTTVMNQKKGSLHFKDEQWVGYDSIAFAKAYFDKNPFIKSITIGYLIDTKSWIFPPEKVTLHINQEDYLHVSIPKLGVELKKLEDIQIPINKNVESIEVIIHNTSKLPEWHPGNGAKAWLFMDEWIFNE